MASSNRFVHRVAVVAIVAAAVGPVSAAGAGSAAPAPDVPYVAQADDPSVTSLATDRGISVAEAQRRVGWQVSAIDAEAELRAGLGARFGGLWIDEAGGGRVKVGVVAGVSGARVTADRLTGIAQRQLTPVTDVVTVRHSAADLDRASTWLSTAMAAANKGASAELTSVTFLQRNVVELQLPGGHALTAAQQSVVDEAQRRFGSRIALGTWEGRTYNDRCALLAGEHDCDAPLRGGVMLYHGSTPWCSTGFTARSISDGKWYVMTAGHCDPRGVVYSAYQLRTGNYHRVGAVHNRILSTVVRDDDMAIVAIDNPAAAPQGWGPRPWLYVKNGAGQGVPGATENQQYVIRGTSGSTVGSRVCMTAGVTGTSCGSVRGVNFGGVVGGQALASYCRQGGDSGGAVFAGNRALGLHSGSASTATCGSALYQGITEAAQELRVRVATG